MAFSTVVEQKKLKCRPATYWHKLATGRHIGFRKTRGGATWIARAYDSVTRKQVKHSLGDFGHLQPNERFGAASTAARDWFRHLDEGGSTEAITVVQACERYAKALENKNERKAKEARRRFAQYVKDDPIANIPLQKLRKHHVEEWRKRLADTPASFERSGERGVGRGKGKGTQTRPRAAITVDRDIVCVRAALNKAYDDGFATSQVAWREPLKSSKAYSRRMTYLERDERFRLLGAIKDEHLRSFVSALAVLPLRPGALATLTVRDFDAKRLTLRIGTDKAGAGRVITLPKNTSGMFEKAARGKLPNAPLFARWDGQRWRTDEWVKAIKAAVAEAKLGHDTVAYSLRHTAITDLVDSGLNPVTVAALAGTSVQMILDNYYKLREDVSRDALATLALHP